MSESTSGDPNRPPAVWVGRAAPPPPPLSAPEDPYWPPLQPGGHTSAYPEVVVRPRRRTGVRTLLVVAGLLAGCCIGGVTVAVLYAARDTALTAEAPPEADQPSADQPSADQPSADQPTADTVPGLGTPVRDGSLEFVVSSASCGHDTLGTLFQATAQGQYCIVEISVTNTGTESQAFADWLQRAVDADGESYSADVGAGVIANQGLTVWEVMEPGASHDGKLVFDIPDESSLAELELHENLFSPGVTVSLAS